MFATGIRPPVALISFAAIGFAAVAVARSSETYSPRIDPSAFSTQITKNPYFSVPVGSKFVYEATTDEGLERTEILIPGWTKTVMGVETLVYWDRVYLDGELVEDTRDYLAQHENGDVWYFGEDVDNYEDGELVDHEGAWISGVDGALPGIWVKAVAEAGDRYRQEFYAGRAEDVAEVVSVSEAVQTPLGGFEDCMKTLESSPLAPDTEHKYYCKATAITTVEVDHAGADKEAGIRTELIDLDRVGALGVPLPAEYAAQGVRPGQLEALIPAFDELQRRLSGLCGAFGLGRKQILKKEC